MNSEQMTTLERKSALSLGAIFSFRMLGLFMVLPVFSIYAPTLTHATPFLVGLALGIYGFSQALLQIPFGMLSDRIGRKRVIVFGLCLFALGSVIAALAHSITVLIIGRALQGAGAVGSTIIALVADLTREESRTKAMAMIGMCIGLSFSVAIFLGPMVAAMGGLADIFWLTAVLAVVGIVFLLGVVPNPTRDQFHHDAEVVPVKLREVLRDPALLRLDIGILCSHASMVLCFLGVPILLHHLLEMPMAHQGLFYLPILVISFIVMVPFIIVAEKKRKMKPLFQAAILLLVLSQLSLAFWHSALWLVAVPLFCYFAAFNFLEASLPSLISKAAPASSKGSAMGVYSSCQFFGIFLGGVLGGVMLTHFGVQGVFFMGAVMTLGWWLVTLSMPAPRYLSTQVINAAEVLKTMDAEQLMARLSAIGGIADAVVISEEKVAYLKVDKQQLDPEALKQLFV